MATAAQLKALVRSHAEGDEQSFYAVAMQVAASEARSGHRLLAQEIRDLVDSAKARAGEIRHPRPTPVVQPKGELAGLLGVSYPSERLADLVVDDNVRLRLQRVLTEHRQRDQLREHGFEPLHTLLLTGSPGTGKTMTASVLAGELNLPLFMIRLEVLITKFMGETAAKLRLVFDAVEETRGVYLFDEVDALAGDRTSASDVGEIRRVLNSFLQFLDRDRSASLIVATTNHPALLDRAVFRRFDAAIDYPTPTPAVAQQVMENRLASLDADELEWPAVLTAAAGLSHAELVAASEEAAKDAILGGHRRIVTERLVAALHDRQRPGA